MRTTYPEAEFDLTDVTAREDGTPGSGSVADFADLSLLKETGRMGQYGTMEHNQFLLDGSREIFPAGEDPGIAYWSADMSDGEGRFREEPGLQVDFTGPHSSMGLTLYFSGDIPSGILVQWYAPGGEEKLAEAAFSPDGSTFFCGKEVEGYGKLVIAFTGTTKPFRHVKVDYLEYGRTWKLGRDTIKTAGIYEEADPTSATLSINTADIQFLDEKDDFSLARQDGLWRFLQKEQEVRLVEYVDGKAVECGTFYLDGWSVQKNLVSLSFVDLVGLMDRTSFYGGAVYDGVAAGDVIGSIMASCGVTDYSIEPEVYAVRLSGWLGIQGHRAALQQVTFACGAVADCSRGKGIRIYRPGRYVSHTVGLDRRFLGTRISLDEYISDVSVDYTQYVPDDSVTQVYKGILSQGMNRINFSQPFQADSLAVSAGEVVEAATNYITVLAGGETECIITGRKYVAVKNSCSTGIPVLAAGKSRKTKKYSGCTVMDAALAGAAAERILEYYRMQQLVEMRYVSDGECAGDWCSITMRDAKYATTGITSQSIDLTGGFIATARCRGYSRTVTEMHYAGEIYAGERGLV